MASHLRIFSLSVVAVAAAVSLAGCASVEPGAEVPESTATPVDPSSPDQDGEDFEAAWLDAGRLFAVVTYGSSSAACTPVVGAVSAEGQRVTVELADQEGDVMCTADYQARASIGGIPEGVDPTQDVELVVTYNGQTDDIDLDGDALLTGTPGTSTDYAPSAGWFDDEGLVLLTWGSGTPGCQPLVQGIEASGNTATVTLALSDQACQKDMRPQAMVLSIPRDDDDAPFELTLVGANLDGTVPVIG